MRQLASIARGALVVLTLSPPAAGAAAPDPDPDPATASSTTAATSAPAASGSGRVEPAQVPAAGRHRAVVTVGAAIVTALALAVVSGQAFGDLDAGNLWRWAVIGAIAPGAVQIVFMVAIGAIGPARTMVVVGKFLFCFVGALVVSEALILTSSTMLQVPAPTVALQAVATVAICFGLSGLSVGLGAVFPNLKTRNLSLSGSTSLDHLEIQIPRLEKAAPDTLCCAQRLNRRNTHAARNPSPAIRPTSSRQATAMPSSASGSAPKIATAQ